MFESFVGHVYGDGLLADSVNMICLFSSCATDAVSSEVHDQWASRKWRA